MNTTLKSLREEYGKSRREVAAALGVSYSTYAHYESGIRRISLEQVKALCELYRVTAEEIITAQLSSCQYAR